MRRIRKSLTVLALAAVLGAGAPRLLAAQEFNECWSTCHAMAMVAVDLYSLDYATRWFKGCINTNCPELAPI